MSEIFFASLLFLFIGNVFGTFGGDKLDETTEDDIYVCYHDMHCTLGDEGYNMAKECHNMVLEEDWKLMWEWYAELGFSQFVNQYADELTKRMCPMEEDDKKKLFDTMSVKLTKGLSEECTRNSMDINASMGRKLWTVLGLKLTS